MRQLQIISAKLNRKQSHHREWKTMAANEEAFDSSFSCRNLEAIHKNIPRVHQNLIGE